MIFVTFSRNEIPSTGSTDHVESIFWVTKIEFHIRFTFFYFFLILAAPEFLKGLRDLSMFVKDKVIFHCSVSDINAQVTWAKNGIQINQNDPRFQIISEGKFRE